MEAADTTATADELETDYPAISAIRHSDDRTVFIEADNTDGWIATDYTVGLTE